MTEHKTPTDIKAAYLAFDMGYDTAIILLKRRGFTEFSADQYLFSEVTASPIPSKPFRESST